MSNSKVKWGCVATIIIGLIVKISWLDYQFADYIAFLEQWVKYMKANGYFYSLKDVFYNYTPLYMYVLALIAKLGVYPLYAIKFLSIFFDYIIAFFCGGIAYQVTKKDITKWLAFAIIPIIPTVILNGAVMAQCDAIYVAFTIGSVYFLFKRKLVVSMIFLGIAFSLKAQAAMVLPFFFIFMLRGGVKWYHFTIVPLVYVVSVLPAWALGRPIISSLLIYRAQASYSANNGIQELVSFFPNIYQWIDKLLNYNSIYGLATMTIITLVSGYILSQKKYTFTLETWIKLLLLSTIICPFLLPGMHERYMYSGDIVAGLYILLYPRKAYLGLGIIFVSFYSYIRCLYALSFDFGLPTGPHEIFSFFEFISWKPVSLLYAGVIALLIFDFVKTLKTNKIEDEFAIGAHIKNKV